METTAAVNNKRKNRHRRIQKPTSIEILKNDEVSAEQNLPVPGALRVSLLNNEKKAALFEGDTGAGQSQHSRNYKASIATPQIIDVTELEILAVSTSSTTATKSTASSSIRDKSGTFPSKPRETGGLLRIPPQALSQAKEVPTIVRSSPRPGVDIPPVRSNGGSATAPIKVEVTVFEQELNALKILEVTAQRWIESLRRDKQAVLNCIQSISLCSHSSEYHTLLKLETKYQSLFTLDIKSALAEDLLRRCCTVHQRYFESFLKVLSGDHSTLNIGTAKTVFEAELRRFEGLVTVISDLLTASSAGPLSPEEVTARRLVAHTRGDNCKYYVMHLTSSLSAKAHSVEAFEHYQSAIRLAPEDGTAYKAISSLMKMNQNRFLSLYYLLRSMCVPIAYDGRESLVHLFEQHKLEAGALTDVNILAGLSFDEHKYRVRVHFVTCAGIAYTRVNADHFAYHVDCLKRHLAVLLQAFAVSASTSAPRSADALYAFNKTSGSMFTTDIDFESLDVARKTVISAVEEDLYEMVVFCLSLLHIIAEKHRLKELLEDICDKYSAASDAHSRQQAFTMDMHKLQCVPGLSDVLVLLFSMVSIASGGRCGRLLATLRPINVFLQWLAKNPVYWAFASFEHGREIWAELEANLFQYIAAFPPLAMNGMCTLEEDVDLRGFIPLMTGCGLEKTGDCQEENKRGGLFTKDAVLARITRIKKASEQLSNEVLALRSSSGGVVFLGKGSTTSAASQRVVLGTCPTQSGKAFAVKELKSETSRVTEHRMFSGQVDASRNVDAMVATMSSVDSIPKASQASITKAHSGLVKKAIQEPALIVIDAANVAMRHGLKAKFSCNGIQLALDFFRAAGHKTVAFLPDHYMNFERVGELRRAAKLGMSDVRVSQIPDDIPLLHDLISAGILIGTPPQDYDDSYCISFARQHNGFIVTNDMYRDHIERLEGGSKAAAKQWMKSHLISFTFVGDTFMPNPDCDFFSRPKQN